MSLEHTDFAQQCRDAGLAFMRGTAEGWGRRELAMWLVGKYSAVASKPKEKSSTPPSSERVTSESVSDMLREARWKAFADLEEAAHGSQKLVHAIVGKGLVARDPKLLWVPVDRPGARLRMRVLSLFAVDCLIRPDDYKTLLLACPRCEQIVFDADARREGRCCGRKPAAQSGVRPRLSDFRRSIPPEVIATKSRK